MKRLVSHWNDAGSLKWRLVADDMSNRTDRQCRERWQYHVSPDVKKTKWSDAEDSLLLELQKKHGNKWSKIAKELPGRTDNNVVSSYDMTSALTSHFAD